MSLYSPYFTRKEFACQCGCGYDTVDAALLTILEGIRSLYGAPVTVTSGCRCDSHNRNVGGSKNSQHRMGKAADIKVQGVDPTEVYDQLDNVMQGWGGLGLYESWVHVDVRDEPARWEG